MEANGESLPAVIVAEGSVMPDTPSGFGCHNDDGTDLRIDPDASSRLTQGTAAMTGADGWAQKVIKLVAVFLIQSMLATFTMINAVQVCNGTQPHADCITPGSSSEFSRYSFVLAVRLS